MKRRLLIAAIFLLAGAVVNVAVAWGFDTWNDKVLKTRVSLSDGLVEYTAEYYEDLDLIPIQIQWGRTAVGWPTDSLGYTWDEPRPWSLHPIWPGFAVNTLFYAAVLWLLIPGPFVLRRVIRVKRGLCPACAYPMGESAVCSECGKALAVRASATT